MEGEIVDMTENTPKTNTDDQEEVPSKVEETASPRPTVTTGPDPETQPAQPVKPPQPDQPAKPPQPAQSAKPKDFELCVSPSPSGEELPPDETKKIITLTNTILQLCQTKVDDQKISSHSLSYMMLRIKESLNAYYSDYIPKLNTFMYHADKITADMYVSMCCSLPPYGDYVKAIEAVEGETVEVGWASPVSKKELIALVEGVTDNYQAAAMFVKSSRGSYKDIYSHMCDRKEIFKGIEMNIPHWVKLQDNITEGLEDIREQTFKMSAYLDFLKQGESKTSPTLDLSLLNQTNEDEKEKVTEVMPPKK